jgi:hypothetical protein
MYLLDLYHVTISFFLSGYFVYVQKEPHSEICFYFYRQAGYRMKTYLAYMYIIIRKEKKNANVTTIKQRKITNSSNTLHF